MSCRKPVSIRHLRLTLNNLNRSGNTAKADKVIKAIRDFQIAYHENDEKRVHDAMLFCKANDIVIPAPVSKAPRFLMSGVQSTFPMEAELCKCSYRVMRNLKGGLEGLGSPKPTASGRPRRSLFAKPESAQSKPSVPKSFVPPSESHRDFVSRMQAESAEFKRQSKLAASK